MVDVLEVRLRSLQLQVQTRPDVTDTPAATEPHTLAELFASWGPTHLLNPNEPRAFTKLASRYADLLQLIHRLEARVSETAPTKLPLNQMSHTEMLNECVLWLKVGLPYLPDNKPVDDTNRVTGERLNIRPLPEAVRQIIREADALLALPSEASSPNRSAEFCEAHTNVVAPHCPICTAQELDALREFYEGVKVCFGDTWECVSCGRSEPWWTECNADYATREAVKRIGERNAP